MPQNESQIAALPDEGAELRAPAQRRPLYRRALEVIVSLVFLALALRGVRLGDLWDALRRASYLWLLLAVAITVLLLLIKGWRWQLLFYPEYRLPYGSVLTALCAGYLASNVLPARLGEVVRLLLLAGEQPVSVARTFSTIVIERLLDVLTLWSCWWSCCPSYRSTCPPRSSTAPRGWVWWPCWRRSPWC